jgi:hypothetical protein
MNVKNFKPYERLPRDLQMLITNKVYQDCYKEVMNELNEANLKIKLKNIVLPTFEYMYKNIKKYEEDVQDIMPNIMVDILSEYYSAGYIDLVPSYFECLNHCICCEYHSLTPLIRLEDDIYRDVLKYHTDKCKCNCMLFRRICIEARLDTVDEVYENYKDLDVDDDDRIKRHLQLQDGEEIDVKRWGRDEYDDNNYILRDNGNVEICTRYTMSERFHLVLTEL